MSTNLPPGSPAPGSPDGPEFLEMGGGGPIPARSPRRSPRAALLAAAAAGGLALAGAGAWAVWSFLSTGAQPAEALPADTIAYVSVDLDPSGRQKIEALRMLRKFPAFEDHIGLGADDDVRQRIVEELLESAPCADLSWSDVEPWLGNRAALAAVDGGDGKPAPVGVVQVTDASAAREGVAKLAACGTPSPDTTSGTAGAAAWRVEGDWALVAEDEKVLDRVVAAAGDGSLADDEDFRRWTEAAGDPGVMTMYAAPEAGAVLARSLDSFGGLSSGGAGCVMVPGENEVECTDYELEGSAGYTGSLSLGSSPVGSPELTRALEDFRGMAATVRFDDGGLELEVAADPGVGGDALGGDARGDDVLATLPADTAVAVGAGFGEGWFSELAEQVAARSGGGLTATELLADLSRQSGLDLPADAETLAGDALALAVGPDVDLERFFTSPDGSGLPVALKVQGDPDGIESVLDKLRGRLPGPEVGVLGSDSSGDMVVIGPDADYRSQVLDRGELGSSEAFRRVVPDAGRADVVVYVNFDAGDWLARSAGEDSEARANLEPLQALGMSTWWDDGAAHAKLRVTVG